MCRGFSVLTLHLFEKSGCYPPDTWYLLQKKYLQSKPIESARKEAHCDAEYASMPPSEAGQSALPGSRPQRPFPLLSPQHEPSRTACRPPRRTRTPAAHTRAPLSRRQHRRLQRHSASPVAHHLRRGSGHPQVRVAPTLSSVRSPWPARTPAPASATRKHRPHPSAPNSHSPSDPSKPKRKTGAPCLDSKTRGTNLSDNRG